MDASQLTPMPDHSSAETVTLTESAILSPFAEGGSVSLSINRVRQAADMTDALSIRWRVLPDAHEYDLLAVGVPERVDGRADPHARIISDKKVKIPSDDLEEAFGITAADLDDEFRLVAATGTNVAAFRTAASTSVDAEYVAALREDK